jgi:uncharacterized protein with gpF-like domain
MIAATGEGLRGQMDLGTQMVDDAVRVLGGSELLPTVGVSIHTLAITQAFSADLITNITGTLRRRINAEIQQGLVGAKTPYDVMQAIGDALPDSSVFSTVEFRAETIVRTEMGRAFGMATQARQQEASLAVPEMKKQWRWSHKGRVNHAAIDGQIRDVHLPFDVPGARHIPAARLMFPGDPAGPPGQTINCGCQSLPYVPGLSRDLQAAA